MPIPKPKQGEHEDVFIPRCMRIISDEYAREQAYVICKGQIDKHEMKQQEEIFVLKPKKNQNRGSYLSYCSAHSKMKEQFPNMKERMGQCLHAYNSYYRYWSKLEDFAESDTEGTVLGDCIAKQRATGLDYKEAYARCASKVVVSPTGGSNPVVMESNLIVEPVAFGEDISVDFDDTFDTDKGRELVQKLVDNGDIVHIITRRQQSASKAVYDLAKEFGILRDNIHFTNGKLKWETIKRLGIKKHIDNNPDEIKAIKENLPDVEAIKF
jgi:hypothetical protein